MLEKQKNTSETITIDIPKITTAPTLDDGYRFSDFNLENLNKLQLQPVEHKILIQKLRKDEQTFLNTKKDN